MPDYPKTTGELVTVKDPADNTTKLLDTLIQLLRNADESTLQALQTLTETVQNLSGQAWKNNQTNLPASNNAFDIGSASQMIKSIYSMGMTLGREGYEWEINDTDGYAILSNGLLLQWGKKRLARDATATFYLGKSYFISVKAMQIHITVCIFNFAPIVIVENGRMEAGFSQKSQRVPSR